MQNDAKSCNTNRARKWRDFVLSRWVQPPRLNRFKSFPWLHDWNKSFSVIVLLGLIFVTSVSARGGQNIANPRYFVYPSWQQYTDLIYDYTISYPPSWHVRPTPTDGWGGLAVFEPPGTSQDAKIEIGVWPYRFSSTENLKLWFEEQLLPGATTTKARTITLQNAGGWVIERSSTNENKSLTMIAEKDGAVYVAVLYGAVDEYEELFTSMLRSIILPQQRRVTLFEPAFIQNYPSGIPNNGYPVFHFNTSAIEKFILPFGAQYPGGSPWRITQTGDGGYTHKCPARSDQPNCGALDFGLPQNTPVYAANNGMLAYAGWDTDPDGFGTYVIVQHQDMSTYSLYGHLNTIEITYSGPVNQGQLLGKSGDSGCCPGDYHLHFGISVSNEPDRYTPVNLKYYPGIVWNDFENPDNGCVHNGVWDCGDALGVPEFFPDRDFNGESQAFGLTTGSLLGQRIGNDNIESLRVPTAYAVNLYRDTSDQGWGPSDQYANPIPVPNLDGKNVQGDQASAIAVYRGVCVPGTLLSLGCDPLPPPPPNNDNATFVADVTLPDGTVVSPGQNLGKIWRMRNTGSTTWGSGYQLVFIGGEQMGAPGNVSVPVTAPNQEVDISINLTAPSTGGDHVGHWRLRNPQGTYFGPTIWVHITIPNSSPPPTDAITLTCIESTCPATVAPGATFRPTIRAQVHEGQLLESRGDMLRNTDGNLFGAWPHIAVQGVVNQGGTHNFTFYANNPISAPTSEGTYQTKWRIWRDGNWAGPELTIQFEVTQSGNNNHPPYPPTLTSPGDWAVFQGTTPTLCAQHNGDPDGDAVTHYQFDIFESGQIHNSGWITNNCWTPPNLQPYGYQWHVKVRDNEGAESSWSNTWHFTIYDPQIDITQLEFVPLDPASEQVRILACADAPATLKVEVNTANDGSANGEWRVLKELGVPCFNNEDAPVWNTLEYEGGPHRVRVLARGEGGWESAAVREEVFSVPLDHRPNQPFGQLPTNEAYLASRTVTFDWIETLNTNDYRLEASLVPDFNSLLLGQEFPAGTTSHTYTFDQDYPTVYWRVIATGDYGSNEARLSFHIDLDSPISTMQALSPTTTDTFFTVNWSGLDDRAGLRWYHVQVREGNRPNSEWEDWLVNTTQTAMLYLGQPGHEYYFRVRAMDNVGNWEEWPTGDGDTHTLIDLSAAPPSPWWNANYTWRRNLVILNNDGDTIPTHYPMHIHFDNTTTPTAADIYNASVSPIKGDDVRVVYDNLVELDRFIQRFSPDTIDVWFPMQVSLGGGQTNNSSYQMYYGHSTAASPPSNENAIFLPEADSNTILLAHFQEGASSTIYDSSGRGHHGNFSGAGWIDGYLGYAGLFNGSTSQVDFGNHTDFNLGAMTLEAWILVTEQNGNYEHIFDKETYWLRLTGGRQPHFFVFGNESGWSCPTLNLNTWYHLAVTYNGSNRGRIYINGQMCNERIESRTPYHTGANFRIAGEHVPAPLFPGYIQHVRVSNIERTDFPYGRIDIPASVAAGAATHQPGSGTADLAILELSAYPNPTGGVLIQALVENQGELSTQNGFFTDLYLDHIPTGAGDYSGSIQFWVNTSIQPGATLTLTTVLNDLSQLNHGIMQANAPMAEVGGLLYAQADSTGVISESNKNNNIHTNGLNICVANADAFEFDDTRFAATPVQWDTRQAHNFHTMGDEDWFAIPAVADQTYTITTVNLGLQADTYLHVYGTNGTTLIASNDDYGGTLASRVEWTAPTTGTYYVMVKHWNPNSSGCGTRYTILFGDAKLYLPIVLRP